MKYLIVNADDFGMNRSINDGIFKACKQGVVVSVSMMVTQEDFKHAVELLKSMENIGVGIHLDLDKFFYINHIKGRAMGWIEPKPSAAELISEIKSQIEKLLEVGVKIDHLSSHHHTHLEPDVLPYVCEVAKAYNIWAIRFHRRLFNSTLLYEEQKKNVDSFGLIYLPHFIEGWYFGNIDEPYEASELMTHPGYGEVWREFELAVCCNQELKGYMRGKDIRLITFRDYINIKRPDLVK